MNKCFALFFYLIPMSELKLMHMNMLHHDSLYIRTENGKIKRKIAMSRADIVDLEEFLSASYINIYTEFCDW